MTAPRRLQLRRGNTAAINNYVGAPGELVINTDDSTLYVHDGITVGGIPATVNTASVTNAVGSAEANIILANVGMLGYVNLANTIQSAQLISANLGIIGYVNLANTIQSAQITSANLGIIGYVNLANTIQSAQISAANIGIKGYIDLGNSIQATAITSANLGMKGYVDSVAGGSSYGNANVKVFLSTFDGNILPSANVTYSLGSPTRQWRDLFVSNNTIYIGGTPLSISSSGNLTVNGNVIPTINYVTTAIANVTVDLSSYALNANVTAANLGMKGYIDNQITTIVGGAPGTLDTLNELANALGRDANLSVTITNQIANVNANITTANLGMKGYVDSQSFYSNAKVATYLQVGSISNISVAGNVTATYFVGNGALLTGITAGSSYSNVQVATYLPTYDGNIAANISKAGYTWAFGTNGALTLPGATAGETIATSGGYITVGNLLIGQGGSLFNSNNDSWALYGNRSDAGTSITIPSNDSAGNGQPITIENQISNVEIVSGNNTWNFDVNANLTLPAGGVIAEGGGLTGAIRLTPAGGANANQALLIYPTAGGDGDHVHLTAGGGSTELYLGNDYHYVKLVDGGNIELRATTTNLSPQASWTFDTAGNIDARQALGIKVPNGVPTDVAVINSTTGSWELNPRSDLATTGGTGTGLLVNVTETGGYASTIAIAEIAGTGYTNGDVITVTSGTSSATFTIVIGGRNTWQFGTDRALTLPSGTSNIQSVQQNGYQSKVTVSPFRILSQARRNQSQSYSAANEDFTSAASDGNGMIAFVGLQGGVAEFITDTMENGGVYERTVRLNGAGPEYQYASFNDTNDELFLVTAAPAGAVTEIRFSYTRISKIDICPDEGVFRIESEPSQDIDIQAGNDLDIFAIAHAYMTAGTDMRLRSGTGAVTITTNHEVPNATPQVWQFGTSGELTLPNGAVLRNTANNSVAFGQGAGLNSQGATAIAIGADAGYYTQGAGAVAVGESAGESYQGANAVAIGKKAGYYYQANNSIILNATGDPLEQTTANTFTVAPIRTDSGNTAQALYYNTTTKEITYANVTAGSYSNVEVATYLQSGNIANISVAGNVTATYFIGNGALLTGIAAGSSYSNVQVATYLPTYTGVVTASNVAVAGNVTAQYLFGNGSQLTGIAASSNYSNVQVAAYLATATITTTGNITAGNLFTSGALYVANITTTGSSGNISGANYITANYFVGNGALLTGIVSSGGGTNYSNVNTAAYTQTMGFTNYSNVNVSALITTNGLTNYSNVNVAAYLSTATINTTGNITAAYLVGNISITGNVTGTSPNVTLQAGIYTSVFDNQGNVTVPRLFTSGNIQTSGYLYGNGAFLTGIVASSNYSNANVAAYLTNYDGDINFTSSVAIISNVDVITVMDHIRSPSYQYSNGVSILAGLGNNYSNVNVQAYTETMGFTNYSNVNVAAYLSTNSYLSETTANLSNYAYNANVTAANLGMKGYVDSVVGGGSSYSNVQVATYLPTYTGNISADIITASGNVILGTIRGNNTVSLGGPTTLSGPFPEQIALSLNNTLYGNALGLSNISFVSASSFSGTLTASVPHRTAGIYDARIYTSSPQIGANTSITTLIHFSAQVPNTGVSSTANIGQQYGGWAYLVGSASTGSNIATSAGWVANVRNAGNNYSFISQTLGGPNNWAFYDQGGAQSYLAGNLTIANTLVSTSNVTGALTVAGGVGISGNVNIDGANGAGTLSIGGYGLRSYINFAGNSTTATSMLSIQNSSNIAYTGSSREFFYALSVTPSIINSGTGGANFIDVSGALFQPRITSSNTATKIQLYGLQSQAVRGNPSDISSSSSNFLSGISTTHGHGPWVSSSAVTSSSLGVYATAYHYKGTITNIYNISAGGMLFLPSAGDTATATNVSAIDVSLSYFSGFGSGTVNITNAYGVNIDGPIIGANATVGTYYGLKLNAPTVTGTLTNRYGIYQGDSSSLNYLAGNLTIANTAPSTSTTTGALIVAGGVGVAGNVFAGNVSATYFTGNGAFLTALPGYAYSNVNVKAYTESMGFANYSNVNVAALITTNGLTNYSNVNVKAYTESMGFTNYSNANVAAYLPTYTGNISAGNITATGNITAQQFVSTGAGTATLSATTNLDLSANTAVRVVGGGTFRLPQLTTAARDALIASNGDVIYNTTQSKFQTYEGGTWANVVGVGGSSTYSNVNVASYLGTGQVTISNIKLSPSGNIVFADGTTQTTASAGGITTWATLQDKNNANGPTAIALGANAGSVSQGINAVAIGYRAGNTSQGNSGISIGGDAGKDFQSVHAIAIGNQAADTSQGAYSVAIGSVAAQGSQGAQSIAIGHMAAQYNQRDQAVSIGTLAGQNQQGQRAIAIGYRAGETNQGNNSIIINATGIELNQTRANTFTVAPVRIDTGNVTTVMYYNITTKEVTYANGNLIVSTYNGPLQSSNVQTTTANIQATTASTSTATGALRVMGGAGIRGNLNVGSLDIPGALHTIIGNVDVSGAGTEYFNIAGNVMAIQGSFGSINATGAINTTGNIITGDSTHFRTNVNSTLTSTSASTGALAVAGGAGIGGNLYVGSTQQSTSTTTGALVVTGGIGVAGNINAGNVSTTGNVTAAYIVTTGGFGNISQVDTITANTVNSTSSIRVSGNIAVNGPAFGAYANTAVQTITSGTQQKVQFQVEEYDTNSNFANSRFTPTASGIYQFNAEVRFDGSYGTGESMIVLYKNGAEHKRGWNSSGVNWASSFGAMTVSTQAMANGTGDYFEIYVQQTSGGNLTITAVNNPAITWFNGCMLRGL